ncbi:MAG: hypothetical protein R3B96_22405 [Pirellulaceae bacterium]
MQQIYVSGCSGDVTAGKFNDGSHDSRLALADRLYDAMVRAWDATKRFPLEEMRLRVAPLQLPWHPSESLSEESLVRSLEDTESSIEQRILAAMGLASYRRVERGQPIDLVGLDFLSSDQQVPTATVLLFPGEAFVGYQQIARDIAAEESEGERFLFPIGYGESWTGYLPTAAVFADGFTDHWLWVGPGSEAAIRESLRVLLDCDEDPQANEQQDSDRLPHPRAENDLPTSLALADLQWVSSTLAPANDEELGEIDFPARHPAAAKRHLLAMPWSR